LSHFWSGCKDISQDFLSSKQRWGCSSGVQYVFSLEYARLLPVVDIGNNTTDAPWSPLGSGVLTGKYNKSSNKENDNQNNTGNKDYKQTKVHL
jgi:hypothetical protein